MTREKQISEAIKLIAPKDRVACAEFLAKALDDIDATKEQRQHEEDVASKAAIEALGTYQAALERARAAKLALPAGLKRDLALLNKISRQDQVDLGALIRDCDRLRNRAPRARVDLSKLSAAA